ncbi:MAG: thiamine-phosphate kinase [Chloroflexi bacterium]|nr:thiamine-phosphate kinase [Chloroflexota bacterium]
MAIILPMKVSELGEFGLIELLSGIVPQGGREHKVVAGIGDDAAAWRGDGFTVLATTDALVQGVHFMADSPWWELGWKAVAVNLSDIAAMGGVPRYALVALSLPADTEVDNVVQLYRGMAELANQFNVAIVGGNTTSAPVVMITMTVIGQAQSEGMLTRSAAVPGDLIAVTGYLGSSVGGLMMLTHNLRFAPETADFLRKAYLQPQPRVVQGQLLVRQGVRAGMDISDGLIADLGHLCKASRVGAIVRAGQIPIHPTVRAAFPEDSINFALTGGEDYELLFAANKETIDNVGNSPEADCPVTVIGEIISGSGISLLGKDGKPSRVDKKGWDHFKKGG